MSWRYRSTGTASDQMAPTRGARIAQSWFGGKFGPRIDIVQAQSLLHRLSTSNQPAITASDSPIEHHWGVQVGRNKDPLQDAACLRAIRAAVGPAVSLRADANRLWGRTAAVAFGVAAEDANLQFIEEPVADPLADLAAFHQATGLPVALDESVDAGEALSASCQSACSIPPPSSPFPSFFSQEPTCSAAVRDTSPAQAWLHPFTRKPYWQQPVMWSCHLTSHLLHITLDHAHLP